MAPHCTVRPWMLIVAFTVALTLEPIKKSLCTISSLLLLDGLTQSPSEAVPLDLLWEGPEASLTGGQSVGLWEEGVQNSLCLFTGTPWDGVSSSDLVGVSNHLLRASNLALLAVCGSQSDSSELPLVTPLAFSNPALAHLGHCSYWEGLVLKSSWSVHYTEACLLQGLSVEWVSSLWLLSHVVLWLREWHHAWICELLPFQEVESTGSLL